MWEIDKKAGIARLGDCEIGRDGTGRIKLASASIVAAQAVLSAQEAKPVIEGDYLTVPFRSLSAVLIEGWWLDLTDEAMLRAAVPLFDRVTIYGNHKPDVNAWLGVMMSPTWSPASGSNPAGVNTLFKIDAKENPRIAKGLTMEPPAINAASVEIRFAAQRSHSDMGWEFYENLGREVDGEIVRYLVTKIFRIPEVSLVYSGADPNARQLSVPGINMEEKGNMEPKNDIEKVDSKKLKALEADSAALAELKKEIGDVPVSALLDAKKWHDGVLEKNREAAVAAYQLAKGEAAKPEMIEMIKSANFAQAAAFLDEFQKETDSRHQLKCKKCGSLEISREQSAGSSIETDEQEESGFNYEDYKIGKK